MLRTEKTNDRDDLTAQEDVIFLADGETYTVRRADLAEAKSLLAAQKAAQRRARANRAARGQQYDHGERYG